jgi:P4 family phage/plasmid primase-like protien
LTVDSKINDDNSAITVERLIKLHDIGFKLIPLDDNGKAVESWTPVYENPNYWSPERLERESYKFKNIATCSGKTHLKDEQGKDLYLNCLDIDSDNVYFILFNLVNDKTGQDYSMIAQAQQSTFVTKTKKDNGFHIYWLSHKQNEAIVSEDCKKGFEFEIKTDKKRGHCTLPPSAHRDDVTFRYKNYGQDKIIVSDKLYDEIMKLLAECLKTESEGDNKKYFDPSRKSRIRHSGTPIELSDDGVHVILESISPYYKKGCRHNLAYSLSGLCHKYNVTQESATKLIEALAKDDEERKSRLASLDETYKKDPKAVSGSKCLLNILEYATGGENTIAKEILEKIFEIISNGKDDDPVLWLTQEITKEFTFKTMKDNEQIYNYDNNKGLYVAGGEWLIKEYCEMMHAEITSHQVQEVINHIKRKTGVDRSQFDSNPDMLNLENGLLNINDKVLSPHSVDYLSTVQLQVEYKERAVPPRILKFLRDVLCHEDIHVVLQMIGYCLYRDCEYEKAFMLFGGGSNGKGVLIKLIESFLGETNCSHRSLQDLDKNRFAAANLYGKLANTFADLKSLKLSETGNFKMLVSGDSITAERKFEHPFSFRNYAKLIFSANEIPESDDKTDAFYRRWIIFHFDKKFQNGTEDTKLINQLTTHDELSGLLNLALIALTQLIDEGGFHDKGIEQTKKDYEENTNDVNAFLYQECLVDITNPEYSTLATDAYAAYVNFCTKRGTRAVDMNIFGKKLAAKGVYNARHRDNGPKEAYYDGLILRNDIRV